MKIIAGLTITAATVGLIAGCSSGSSGRPARTGNSGTCLRDGNCPPALQQQIASEPDNTNPGPNGCLVGGDCTRSQQVAIWQAAHAPAPTSTPPSTFTPTTAPPSPRPVTVNGSCTTLYDTFAVTGTNNVTYDERVTTVYVRFADVYGNWGPPEPFQTAASQTGGNIGHPSLQDLPSNGYVQFWSWPYAPAQAHAAAAFNISACEVTGVSGHAG
jgi:hypothetical protein